MIRYPSKLQKGDIIGLTATSSAVNLQKIDKAIEHIENLGYKVVETKSVRNPNIKCVSAEPETRAKEFLALWNNPDIKMIIEARGGEFLMETIPHIDYHFKKEKLFEICKWVRGYSDITGLLFYITTHYNIATIECDNLSNYAMEPLHKSLLTAFEAVESTDVLIQENYDMWQKEENEQDSTYQFNLTEKAKCKELKQLNNVEFKGRLIGGCLDVLSIYRGTKWDNVCNWIEQYKEEGIVWHLENCGYNAADVYRLLWEMREQGWFKYVKGFIIGRTYSAQNVEDFTYFDALNKALGNLNVPVVYDLDIGHQLPQWTLVNGSLATVNFKDGKCVLKQEYC